VLLISQGYTISLHPKQGSRFGFGDLIIDNDCDTSANSPALFRNHPLNETGREN
jgi:hypothetical protein